MPDKEKAIREVLENIERQRPYLDCNQCWSYTECEHDSSIGRKCIFAHNEKMSKWLIRKEKWLNKLLELYNGETSC